MRSLPPTLAALHWQYPQAAVVVLPLAAAVAAYGVWAYLPQVRQVGRAWAWMLPGLRVAALLTLAVAFMRPAVTRPRTAAELGPVVVLVDDSRSMGAVDTGRLKGQRVGIAAALGRLPGGAQRDAAAVAVEAGADRLGPLADAIVRARDGVVYARQTGLSTDAAAARLDAAVGALRRSARATAAAAVDAELRQTLDRLATPPATVDEEQWLDGVGRAAAAAADQAFAARTAADARLYDRDPAVAAAADAVAGQTRHRLALAAAFDPDAGLVGRLGPDVPVVAFAVGDGLAPLAVGPAEAAPPAADASDLAGGVRAALGRVSAHAPADAEPPRAVVLFSDGRQTEGAGTAESAAAAGVPVYAVAVHARPPSPNLAVRDLQVPRSVRLGESVTCRATVRAAVFPTATTDVTLVAGGERQVRRVTVTTDAAADVSFTWTPTAAGGVDVSVRAAAVPGESSDADNVATGWLWVTPGPAVVAVVATGGGSSAAGIAASLGRAAGVRVVPADAIRQADVVVVVGATGSSPSASGWDAVDRLVVDRGGGAVLVAGEGGFGPGVSPTSPLGRLLPFTGPPPAWAAGPAGAVRPVGEGLWPADDAGVAWAVVPPPGGAVPLVSLRPEARPRVLVGDVPLVVEERRAGGGRVVTVGGDPAGGGPATADRFWAALVRVAAGEPPAVRQAGVSLDADPLAATPGQPVRVSVRLPADRRRPGTVPLRVLGDGDRLVRPATLRPRPGGRYDLTLQPGLPTGDYVLEADVGTARPRVPLRVRPSAAAELADLSGDDDFLHQMTDPTGGATFRLTQLDVLAARLSAPPVEAPRPIEQPLWDGSYLYAGVLGLLMAEWGLRRRAGLA